MTTFRISHGVLVLTLAFSLAGCSGGGLFGGKKNSDDKAAKPVQPQQAQEKESSIWDLFGNKDNPYTNIRVNRYIWLATFDILEFVPIEFADPFGGTIVTEWGSPPGTEKEYKFTVRVSDPALDARSLNVAIITRTGTADPDTIQGVEEAILSRARQLRNEEDRL